MCVCPVLNRVSAADRKELNDFAKKITVTFCDAEANRNTALQWTMTAMFEWMKKPRYNELAAIVTLMFVMAYEARKKFPIRIPDHKLPRPSELADDQKSCAEIANLLDKAVIAWGNVLNLDGISPTYDIKTDENTVMAAMRTAFDIGSTLGDACTKALIVHVKNLKSVQTAPEAPVARQQTDIQKQQTAAAKRKQQQDQRNTKRQREAAQAAKKTKQDGPNHVAPTATPGTPAFNPAGAAARREGVG